MAVCDARLRSGNKRRLAWFAMVSGAGVAMLLPVPGHAQSGQPVPCAESGQPLVRIPELRSQGGKLTGTIVLSNAMQRLNLVSPGATPCRDQDVRQFRGRNTVPPDYPGMDPVNAPPASESADPVPGPTLRARVGDIVQLTLLNQISTAGFWKTLDRGERERPSEGCDPNPSAPYPGPDVFPNCFHGSSTGNIHFHGTHTTPSTTGDNIFLEVRPSIRGANGEPVVTEESVKASFARFFADCERELNKSVVSQWPHKWDDLPSAWTREQEELLKQYDRDIVNKLLPVNEAQIKVGAWPQYHIGAFPFCFRLPEYTDKTWPPAQAAHPAAHTTAVPTEGRALRMGQAPGVQWYHAHKHGSTMMTVANGMTGAFIIEGQYDDDLNRFYGDGWMRRQPLLVINQLWTVPYLFRGRGGPPIPFSVNGRLEPRLTMRPGEVQLWRIVNTSGHGGVFFDGFYTMPPATTPPTNPTRAPFEWKLLAQDGVQLAEVNYDKSKDRSFLMAAGNRADILVKAPANPTAQPQVYALRIREALNVEETHTADLNTLLTVQVEPSPAVTGNQSTFISGQDYPTFPPFLTDIAPDEVKTTKIITFESVPPPLPNPAHVRLPFTMHTIDGKKFDGNIGQVMLLNTAEEWKIENRTTSESPPGIIDHPFHIHINPFQVVEEFAPNEPLTDPTTGGLIMDRSDPDPSKHVPFRKYVFDGSAQTINGARQCSVNSSDPTTWKPCDDKWQAPNRIWRDVFPIPSGKKVGDVVIPGYFKMRSRFVDYAGQYVIHCHILAHEDRGMMTMVQVILYRSPYSHQ